MHTIVFFFFLVKLNYHFKYILLFFEKNDRIEVKILRVVMALQRKYLNIS